MQHCDETDLSLVALGEPAPAGVEDHLRECLGCRRTLASLRQVVDVARDGEPVAVVPPPSVWAAIADATGVTTQPRPGAVTAAAAAWSPAPNAMGTVEDVAANADAVVPMSRGSRARRRRWPLLGVAATSLVVGAVGGSLLTAALTGGSPGNGGQPQAGSVVAAVPLAGLAADPQASGEATVLRESGGQRVLEIDMSKVPQAKNGFYEVWLIDSGVRKMIPVGILNGRKGEFVIPDGLDLGEYPVVDVSVEPMDGNPTHSGDSVLRGSMTT